MKGINDSQHEGNQTLEFNHRADIIEVMSDDEDQGTLFKSGAADASLVSMPSNLKSSVQEL